MDIHNNFMNILLTHLTGHNNGFKGALIKRHDDHFDKFGEYSFPLKIDPWKQYIATENIITKCFDTIFHFTYQQNAFISLDEACDHLTSQSESWPLRLERCIVINGRVHMFLHRISAIRVCFENFSNHIEVEKHSPVERINMNVQENLNNDISSKRLSLLVDVFKNMVSLKGSTLIHNSNETYSRHINFTTKSSDFQNKPAKYIFCAAVLNKKTKTKESDLSAEEYLEKRTQDMQLIAQHKYGLRVKNENRWKIFLTQLGEAAVAFDLLQIKPSHPVSISTFDNGSGCSKGASFVLYNGARLASIINTFNDNVTKGLYPPLPHLNEIDLEQLKDQDEWILVFNFILAYSGILKKCLDLESDDCILSPHLLCTFLSGMTGRISMYYRRVRVLMEPRKHLIPMVHARLYLLRSLQTVLNHGLSILNIVPVTQM